MPPSTSSSALRRKATASSQAAARPAKRTKTVAVAPSPPAFPGSEADSQSSGSGSGSSQSGDDDDDGSDDAEASKAAMLRALEAHGMSMFGAALPAAAAPAREPKGKGRVVDLGFEVFEDSDDGEDDESFDEDDSEGGMEDDEERFSGGEDDADTGLPVASSSSAPAVRKPVEITFDPSQYTGGSKATKAEYKAFMVRPPAPPFSFSAAGTLTSALPLALPAMQNSKASKIMADPHAVPEATTQDASDEK